MTDRLTEIAERLEKATPGSWRLAKDPWERFSALVTPLVSTRRGHGFYELTIRQDGFTKDDVELISNAPADLSWLLDEVKRLRAAVKSLQTALSRVTEKYIGGTLTFEASGLEGDEG